MLQAHFNDGALQGGEEGAVAGEGEVDPTPWPVFHLTLSCPEIGLHKKV